MNFTNPTSWMWAALAIPIVIFYILKIRLRRVPVSTVMFWHQIFEEKQPRSIWQKLRHLLSLLLQLAFLMLLTIALTDPFFDWEIREVRRLVVVVDNSGSMRALVDDEDTRLDEAKDETLAIIDSLRPRDEMAIVAAGTQPRVVCGLTGHQRTLKDALGTIDVTDGPTRIKEAIELTRRLISDHENGKAVIVSDGSFENSEELVQADDIVWLPIGEESDNIAITQFQVRRSLVDPVGYQILVEVRNFADEPAETRLELELAGNVVDVIPLKLEADGRWFQVFEKTSPDGGELLAKLEAEDTLPMDNVARAILPERKKQPVLLVSEGNVFLERVFQACPLVEMAFRNDPPSKVPAGGVVAYHKKIPNPLPDGDLIIVQPENATDLWNIGDTIENPIVAKQDKDSPLMSFVRLDNVLMPEARRLTIKGEHAVLAQSLTDDPIYMSIERPNGRVVVLTVNLDQGDLPLRTAFPIMVSNALSWFARNQGELRESFATGAVAEIDLNDQLPASLLGSESLELELHSPDGRKRPLALRNGTTTIGPLDRCGLWRVAYRDFTVTVPDKEEPPLVMVDEVACNLTNPDESDLRPAIEPPEDAETLAAGLGGRPVWFYLIVLAFCLIGTEWFLYQRRFIS
ncbi:MAG: hypothetical protein CMJ78_18245 [Planctomycetaceae bacterium]|nr:hypothetical protein [Planctomycetaceae bacterium]